MRSLRLYDGSSIPQPHPPPPDVSAVRFRSHLENATTLTLEQRGSRPLAEIVYGAMI